MRWLDTAFPAPGLDTQATGKQSVPCRVAEDGTGTLDAFLTESSYFPLGENFVKTRITGWASVGVVTLPARISGASISFP